MNTDLRSDRSRLRPSRGPVFGELYDDPFFAVFAPFEPPAEDSIGRGQPFRRNASLVGSDQSVKPFDAEFGTSGEEFDEPEQLAEPNAQSIRRISATVVGENDGFVVV